MTEEQRKVLEQLRRMSSQDAASWLIENQPYDMARYIPKISWRRPEHMVLANFMLKKIPHASARGYEALLQVMGIKKVLYVIEQYMPIDEESKDLLGYHLRPSLKKSVRTEGERVLVKEFINKHNLN